MRIRPLPLAAASGAALLAAGLLPAGASGTPRPTPAQARGQVQAQAQTQAQTQAHEGTVGATELLAEVTSCDPISHGRYRTDAGARATVPVCGKKGAVFWKADMDIDCDGQRTVRCNEDTDPWFQGDTAFRQSDGEPLKSDTLPYIVVPSPSRKWNYRAAGIKGGGVAAVIHRDQVQYAVVGDTGPRKIIGEASYATARALGIDPDPAHGGTRSGVTYILFTNSRASPIESHSAAVALGERLAEQFLQDN
ncbi:glycoside hydrolase family 75 protein [Streptomyces sp. NL15-2K]|uniref:glycoside hydrolase family 75 protein n=1 Tax=Streptomyces sp. NL15-2K TaxID=376149 RepID=UPI000F55DA4F|nr:MULTISPECIES: glycoside hydrolase family 75 protein [Actinomycetes]WKX14460.1 glycoside hydrolase family 75 protein [Kutzneria buriramensis]